MAGTRSGVMLALMAVLIFSRDSAVNQPPSRRADIQGQVVNRSRSHLGVELTLLSCNQVREIGDFLNDRERERGFAVLVPGSLQPVVVVTAAPQLRPLGLPPPRDVIRRPDVDAAGASDPVDTYLGGRTRERKRRIRQLGLLHRLSPAQCRQHSPERFVPAQT